MQKALFGSVISTYLTLSFTKLSFCLQYFRIFPSKEMRIAIYLVLGGVFAFASVSLLTAIFTCQPVSAWWKYSLTGDKCIDFIEVSKAVASLNIATDLAIIMLPLPGLKRLMLPSTQKIALMAVYALGILYVKIFYVLPFWHDEVSDISGCCVWVLKIFSLINYFLQCLCGFNSPTGGLNIRAPNILCALGRPSDCSMDKYRGQSRVDMLVSSAIETSAYSIVEKDESA